MLSIRLLDQFVIAINMRGAEIHNRSGIQQDSWEKWNRNFFFCVTMKSYTAMAHEGIHFVYVEFLNQFELANKDRYHVKA